MTETKTCRECENDLPLAEFNAKSRWSDGSPRTYHSYCKACALAYNRVVAGFANRGRPYDPRKPAMSPEQRKERRRDLHRARMETDPEYRERFRERKRESARELRRRERERMARDPKYRERIQNLRRRRKAAFVAAKNRREKELRGEYARLDREPFLTWVRARWLNPEEAGEALGIDPRQIRALFNAEYDHVALRTVDRALTNYGRPDLLNDLYPMAV